MKVYVLTHAYQHESGYTLGVYTTEESARAAHAEWSASAEGRWYSAGRMEIEPCELDAPAAI